MGPAWSKLSGSHPQQDPGQRAELLLVQTMVGGTVMPTLERLGEEDRLRRLRGAAAGRTSLLSPDEEAVFNKFNYLGYTEGLLATCTVFGVLFGGFRLAAYRTALRQRVLPSSAHAHAHSAAHRRKYAALDASSSSSSSKNKSASSGGSAPPPAAAPVTDFPIFSSDMWSQLQLLISTCLALWVGTATANLTMDRAKFYRDLAELPQKPGQSALCHKLCPALVEQRRQLLALDSLEPLHEEYLQEKRQQQAFSEERKDLSETEAAAASSSNNESSTNTEMTTSTTTSTTETPLSEFAQAVRRQKPAALWNFPATDELDAVTRLVHNCQRRLDFENECRRRNNHRVDPDTNLVDVPAPGVPERYVRLEDDDQ